MSIPIQAVAVTNLYCSPVYILRAAQLCNLFVLFLNKTGLRPKIRQELETGKANRRPSFVIVAQRKNKMDAISRLCWFETLD